MNGVTRSFSTNRTASSLNDPSPNWSNRPPKETIFLNGCDFEHWLVVVDAPDPNLTRDEIIQSYIATLGKVLPRVFLKNLLFVISAMKIRSLNFKIYSVSTKHYFALGALVSEELYYKLKEIPGVCWVLLDSYLDVKNKDYGGEYCIFCYFLRIQGYSLYVFINTNAMIPSWMAECPYETKATIIF
ncbi:hypothetical protein ZOSMA_10G00010 [Zostera marina]|uniref:MORF/ORRM1/DAG-like MORF domain-containing protein n=1 Tax=Zostera marina TaxID=29655 RepID=A0A0K9Q5E8_ZOSMR|nr:hypothetical protein ZOSMA_10G00010 [Zostera marina]